MFVIFDNLFRSFVDTIIADISCFVKRFFEKSFFCPSAIPLSIGRFSVCLFIPLPSACSSSLPLSVDSPFALCLSICWFVLCLSVRPSPVSLLAPIRPLSLCLLVCLSVLCIIFRIYNFIFLCFTQKH